MKRKTTNLVIVLLSFLIAASDRTGRIYDLVYKGTDRFSGKKLT